MGIVRTSKDRVQFPANTTNVQGSAISTICAQERGKACCILHDSCPVLIESLADKIEEPIPAQYSAGLPPQGLKIVFRDTKPKKERKRRESAYPLPITMSLTTYTTNDSGDKTLECDNSFSGPFDYKECD